jgi:hypothetical protein
MQIPESIDKLTTAVPATSLDSAAEKKLDVDYFSQCIEHSLSLDLKKFYDKGYNYFKITGNDGMSFLKCFFNLFNEYYKSVIKDSNIDLEKQQAINENLDLLLKNIEISFSVFDNFLTILKIDKKTFDSNKLFMIITGYAINNLKKNYRR